MSDDLLPANVKRFLLTSIPSVPHLEAILLLRHEQTPWVPNELARRLYISEKRAEVVLSELLDTGILIYGDSNVPTYCFSPKQAELREILDQLAAIYSRHIVEVTNLIHSRSSSQAQHFADAFKFRKD